MLIPTDDLAGDGSGRYHATDPEGAVAAGAAGAVAASSALSPDLSLELPLELGTYVHITTHPVPTFTLNAQSFVLTFLAALFRADRQFGAHQVEPGGGRPPLPPRRLVHGGWRDVTQRNVCVYLDARAFTRPPRL